MESLKGTTGGEDLFLKVTGVIDRFELSWNKLTNVTTDGSPNLTGKNVGLLKRLQDKMKEYWGGYNFFALHYPSGSPVQICTAAQSCSKDSSKTYHLHKSERSSPSPFYQVS